MSEVNNPVIGYADSYRLMARMADAEGKPRTVEMFSVITDLERNIAPLFAAAKSELSALREELAVTDKEVEGLQSALADAEQRNAELKKQLDSIDKHLRGNVNDPDPLPLIMPGAASYTTTYGLVAGLRRERDYLKKAATPLPAGDDYLRQLAQRLREYVGNPHHIDPVSEAFKRLIDESAFALSKLAALKPTESGASE